MEKVRAGESVEIAASTWNSFIDAANFVKEARLNSRGCGLRSGVGTGIVLVKNAAGSARERFSALVLSGVCVTPETNEDEFVSCTPVFNGVKMTDSLEGKPFAVLLEPLEAGGIGRGMVLGVTPAKVTVSSSDDEYAVPKANSDSGELESSESGVARILWAESGTGSKWCLLQLGGAGAGGGSDKVMMCKVTGGDAQSGYTVDVYPNGRYESSGGSSVMFLPDVALDAALPKGAWIIGHKAMLHATGGNES